MCGIAGFAGVQLPVAEAEARLRAMGEAMVKRGPDSHGENYFNAAGVGFAHRRLAIQDLSPNGHQPMPSASGRFWILFNGEIYNFMTLRRELETLGYHFHGGSDTEVMLAAFEAWGLEPALRRMTGMFVFALLDLHEQTLHLARDRFGEKPLYYGVHEGALLFASELKGIMAWPESRFTLDPQALLGLLTYGNVPGAQAIFSNFRKLLPGHLLTLSLPFSGTLPESRPYWSVTEAMLLGESNPWLADDDEYMATLDRELTRAVEQQMISDVALGAFLSGGIDSSLIVSVMQKLSAKPVKTFTIGFSDGPFNEAEHAKAVAAHLGTEHTELYLTADDALAVVPQLPDIYDEPFADSSQIPTCLVAAMARRHVTVALSGDAGDELFCGYERYHRQYRQLQRGYRLTERAQALLAGGFGPHVLHRLPAFRDLHPAFIRDKLLARSGADMPADTALRYALQTYQRRSAVHLMPGVPPHAELALPSMADARRRMMLHDLNAYLPDDIMTKVDRAAMAVSLETRVPFLDHGFAELALRIPVARHCQDGRGKYLLRQLLYRYVPQSLVDRPKQGFAIPVSAWLRGTLRPWAEALLFDTHAFQGFDASMVRAYWAALQSGRDDYNSLIWSLLMFQAWYQRYRTALA